MYFHLGKTMAVSDKNVVGIFDMENTTVTNKSRIFLEKSQSRGEVKETDFELPKSYVICSTPVSKGKKGKKIKKIYLSSFSPAALVKKSVISEEW